MRFLVFLSLCALAACGKQESFDDKYKAQSEHISASANSIEKEVAAQMTGAAAAERAASEAAASNPPPGNGTAVQ